MIDSLRNYSLQAKDFFAKSVSPHLPSVSDIANKIATVAMIVLSAVLCFLHHNLFACGFVIGFIRSGDIQDLVNKVDGVFKYCSSKSYLAQGCIYFVTGFIALWALPVSIVTLTLYFSSQWGANLAMKGQTAPIPTPKAQGLVQQPSPANVVP